MSYTTHKISFLTAAMLIAGILCISTKMASAQTIQFIDTLLDNRNGLISLRCGLKISETPEFSETLDQGIPMNLSLLARIYKNRSMTYDILLAENATEILFRKNILTNEIVLKANQKTQIIPEEQFYKQLNSQTQALTLGLGPWSAIMRDGDYYLEAVAAIRQTDIPPFLDIPILFWSWDVVPSAEYRIDFEY